ALSCTMIETSAIGVPPAVEATRPLIDASVPWAAIATGQSAIVAQRTPPSTCSRHPPHRTQDAIEKITTSTSSRRSPAPRARPCRAQIAGRARHRASVLGPGAAAARDGGRSGRVAVGGARWACQALFHYGNNVTMRAPPAARKALGGSRIALRSAAGAVTAML